ncbi:WecB/TagA/CpsF family glycosyltransferase [Pseudalkalibacillus berkeleyi]|uniref:N-acetylglucosaminyldiphosphoundecaprenol N-acetyl-beta-D-mannosaminyltransferase n=1 Tax=Pseudalkalibacillus berkeleyi TaxID=1069813 RepID=A0ABS9H4L5_9BACL|nr:WecB/TagA/CpsF family glycosyltransferase [Pseudalkalibacillus berkeleyi]MCF6138772.1 WecB/TagA/CpsF family glycosyltransferase [Pseudalkalibacillus berkeleyi]
MAISKVKILDVPFVNTTLNEFIDHILNEHILKSKKASIVTANPEIVMHANEDSSYMQILHHANYVTADGIGIVKAAEKLGQPLPERVTGYDLMKGFLSKANQQKMSIYLLGAKDEVIQLAKENIQKTYPNLEIVGYHNGYFNWEENDIGEEIKQLKPDFVFVALGFPRQEKWINQHIDQFDKGVFMGVGGCFDVWAGTVKRAPIIWQKVHLEWFYRLLNQPSRIGRMMAIPKFMKKINEQKVKEKS